MGSSVDQQDGEKNQCLENMPLKTCNITENRKTSQQYQNRIPIICRSISKDIIFFFYKKRRNKELKRDWEFSKISDRQQTKDLESTENTRQDKYQKFIPVNIIFKVQKNKETQKTQKVARLNGGTSIEEQE